MTPPALAVKNVSHAFGGTKALKDVSLRVNEGQFCALLGLNGAGKTTLLSLITRLYDNVTGSVEVLGFDVRRQPVRALKHLGVVFQSRTMDLDLSVEQNMLYHASLHGIPRKTAKQRAQIELERVGLLDRLKDKARTLSGGQLRRIEIARSLIHEPKLLLLDEATTGLDIGSRREIVDYVHDLASTKSLGILWATHLFDEIDEDDEAVVLHKGHILSSGSVKNIVASSGADDLGGAFAELTVERPTSA